MDMRADIDTDTDYLNYREVAEVVAELLPDPAMRPISIGIFGTWGTGKSTLLNLIDCELQARLDRVDVGLWRKRARGCSLNQLRGDPNQLSVNLRALIGQPTQEVIQAFVNGFVPESGDADRVRAAMNEALSSCLEGQDEYNFTTMSDEVLIDVMVTYACLSVLEHVIQDSDRAFTNPTRRVTVQ
jgi:hypothetical protein